VELQERLYSCGPAAVRAALYILGHNPTEAAIRRRAGTTPDGTDEKGIIRAVHYYGHGTKEYQAGAIKASWAWLKAELGKGHPVLLCVDEWDHWVTALGLLGGKVLIFDPDSSPGLKRRYSGISMFTEAKLAPRWRHVEDGHSQYYGVVILP
jgi:ABC-type bacteriocin/lantibiotic exporter with double-glycine peptidase domain